MTDDEVRKKLVDVMSNEIDSFERFKTKAEIEIPNLPPNLQSAAKQAINDKTFQNEYLTLIDAYKEVAKDEEVKISNGDDFYSDKALKKVTDNLKTRGLDFDYETDGNKKKVHLKIDSSFLTALGALITKIAGLFQNLDNKILHRLF